MSKSTAFSIALLKLIFKNEAIANIGDASGLQPSATAGNLWLTLCDGDPGEAGTALTNETAYTGYAREPLVRGAGWTVNEAATPPTVAPAADVDFGECSDASGDPLTHFAVVNTASGAGMVLYSGALDPEVTLEVGRIPRIKAATTSIAED